MEAIQSNMGWNLSRSLYTVIEFPNPWAKFPEGALLLVLHFPSWLFHSFSPLLSSLPPLHLFISLYLTALISDLLLGFRFQFLQLRLSIAIYIPFFLLCRDYLAELILHKSTWKQFRWREAVKLLEQFRCASTQGHIVFIRRCCRIHFIQYD